MKSNIIKRAIAAAVCGVLILSLVACGGEMSKEKMLKVAEKIDVNIIADGLKTNSSNFIDEYTNKIVKVDMIVATTTYASKVDKDGRKDVGKAFVVLGLMDTKIVCRLSDDDVKKFKDNDVISVVGKISEITTYDTTDNLLVAKTVVEINPAYFIENFGVSPLFKN